MLVEYDAGGDRGSAADDDGDDQPAKLARTG
jgi:hypothetical protein